MTNRLKVATSGRPAFAEDFAVGGVPGNVLTRVAGPIPGAPDDVEWRPGGGGGGGGGGIPAPTTSHFVFVSQIFGNDVTGDGSEGKPYATIAKADSITTASFVDQWVVMIFSGEYAENLFLSAFVRHVGYDPSAFQFATYPVRLNGNIIGIDPSFTTANALASVSNMMVDGTVDLDYVTAGSADGAVAFTNVCITGATTLNQHTTNDTEFHECVLLGEFTQTGGTCQEYNTSGQDPAQHMTVNGRVDGPTVFNAFGGAWAGDLHASQAVTTEDVTLNLHGFSTGAVRVTAAGGKNPAVNADLGATIENPTLDGSSAAALTAGMRVFKQLIIPGGTVIAAAGTTDVTRTLPASMIGATSIEDMLCNCELTGADWSSVFTAEKMAVSWVYVNNAGTPEVHCMIHTTGAGFTLAVSLPFTFFATLPFVPIVP